MNRATAVDGTDLAWTEAGRPDGPVIMLVHSLGADSSMWRLQAEVLSDRFRLILPDLRRHGDSQAPPGRYDIETLGTDLMAMADAAEVDRFNLCGLSIGGQIALGAAIHHGDRLMSLVAANTAARVGTAEGWQERIRAVGEMGMGGISQAVVSRWFSEGFVDRHPDRYAEAISVFESADPVGYTGCCHALATADLRPDVSSIEVPTLVIGGEVDRSTPPAESEWLHLQIPGSRLAIIEGAAHLSNLDQSARFNQAVSDFLASLPP